MSSFFGSSSLSRRQASNPDRQIPAAVTPSSPSPATSTALPISAGPLGVARLRDDAFWAHHRTTSWNPPVDFHLLDYVSEYDSNLMCPICRSPFVDPVVLSECDHCFCRDCLRQTWNPAGYTPGIPKGNCPTCRASTKLIGRGPVSRILINILDDLVVKCPKHEEGCETQMKRSEVQDHVKNYCGYTWVPCPSESCELPLRRKDGDECLHYGVTCIDCRQTTHMANLDTHWKSECPDRKVTCELCKEPVFYREVSVHAKETCPAITIPCTGASYGCTFRSKRGAINQHTKKCTFAALAPFFEAQAKRLGEAEEKQELMTRKIQVLEGGFRSMEELLQKSESSVMLPFAPTDPDVDQAIQIQPRSSDTRSPNEEQTTSDSAWPVLDATSATPGVGFSSPYTHLLSLHESLRDELSRLSAALSDLDARHSMMMLNENLRLKDELVYLQGQVGGLGRQVGWLTSVRLQSENAAASSSSSAAAAVGRGVAGLARVAGGLASTVAGSSSSAAGAEQAGPAAPTSPVRMGRRLTDEGRTKL